MVFCIVFVWPGSRHSPVRIIAQVQWFVYQNRLEPSGSIKHLYKRNRLLWLHVNNELEGPCPSQGIIFWQMQTTTQRLHIWVQLVIKYNLLFSQPKQKLYNLTKIRTYTRLGNRCVRKLLSGQTEKLSRQSWRQLWWL